MRWPLQRFQVDSCFTLPTCLRIPEEFSKKICKIMIWEKKRCLYTCPWLLLGYRQTYQAVTCYRHTALDLTLDYLVAKAKIREGGLQWLKLWELAWSSTAASLLICNFETIIQCDFYFCFWFCICINKKNLLSWNKIKPSKAHDIPRCWRMSPGLHWYTFSCSTGPRKNSEIIPRLFVFQN